MSTLFDSISGYDSVKTKLLRLVETDRIPQALLFTGSESAPKKEIVYAFSQLILGTDNREHPDIHSYIPEGKVGLHAISSMRKFSDNVYLAPFEAKKKVFIIFEAERMLPTSANALLKTFEEPALDSVIILVSSHPSGMLPTILSRCQKVRVDQGVKITQSKDPLYTLMIDAVSTGAASSYAEVLDLVDQLASYLDKEFKELEIQLRGTMINQRSDQLTAIQKESLNKEIDGIIALQKKTRLKELFIALQSWYRDIHLLKVNANRSLLMNPDYETDLLKASTSKNIPSLSSVEKIIRDVTLSLERSTSPKICIENFFLRLI